MPRGWQERGVIMTKIDIISGFLGAGKTTFIKKLLKEAIAGEKVVLIDDRKQQRNIAAGNGDRMQGSEIQTSGKSGKSMSEMTKFAAFFLILYKSCHLPVLSACVLKKIPV